MDEKNSTEEKVWQRSSRCASNACLEVTTADGAVYIRDSVVPSLVLEVDSPSWLAFLAAAKSGEFDELPAERPR